MLFDHGFTDYCGLDFSEKRIEQARSVCPAYSFVIADVLKSDILEVGEYNTVVCTELLEHIEEDKNVLSKIRKGTRFFGTVPDFMYTSHVRCFQTEEEVRERYSPFFDPFDVLPLKGSVRNTVFYVMEGVRV